MPSITEELDFQFCLILVNFYFNSNMWLMATMLDSTAKNNTGNIYLVHKLCDNSIGIV